MSLRRSRAGEGGQSTVELALVAPLVILLLVGIVDFARVVSAFATTGNASREGARYATLPGVDEARIAAEVKKRTLPLDASQLEVVVRYYAGDELAAWPPPASDPPRAVLVRVDVSYPWAAVTTPLIRGFFAGASASDRFTTSSTMEARR
ncbi:MAG: TadE/TadG family type IV pilus assembly protein [Candidatus Limnocylindria bacterium]